MSYLKDVCVRACHEKRELNTAQTQTNRKRALLTRLALVGLVALHIGCGGGTDGSPIPPPTTPAPTPPPPPPPPEDLVVPPAEAGKIAPDRIAVTLTSEAGVPLPDTPYEWTTDERSGWVFPAEGRSDRLGKVDGAWIPGFPGLGKLTLRYVEADEEKAIDYETFSEAPENPPWAGWDLSIPSPRATGYSIDLTPLTEPPGTYYAAMFWQDGYTGLQRRGDLFDRQLQFSQWDAPDGTPAEIVDVADGVICKRFGHEGTGVQCGTQYPWAVGKTYRFKMTEELSGGVSLVSMHVTDLESSDRRYIGTLKAGRRLSHTRMIPFVEDFRRRAPTCLDQEVRSAAFRRAQARTEEGWIPLVDATVVPHFGRDVGNPGTPDCANYAVREHPAGLEVLMGGPNVRDPHATIRVTIPE